MLDFAVTIGLFKYLKLTFKLKPSNIFDRSLVEKGPRRHYSRLLTLLIYVGAFTSSLGLYAFESCF